MFDYYLRAPDQTTFDSALQASRLTEAAIDCIGPIHRVTGTTANGEPVVQVIEGYHVNLRTAEPLTDTEAKALASLLIPEPAEPVRVWL